MKLLTGTKEMQGTRANDFSFVAEGEIVIFAMECTGEEVDGACGCHRAMSGIACHLSTTTMKVVDIDITKETLKVMLQQNLETGGWAAHMTASDIAKHIEADATELIKVGSSFEVGMVIEKRGETLQPRAIAPQGIKFRIDYLPGKLGEYKYEVYAIGPRQSGVAESFNSEAAAKAYIKTAEQLRFGCGIDQDSHAAKPVAKVFGLRWSAFNKAGQAITKTKYFQSAGIRAEYLSKLEKTDSFNVVIATLDE